MNKFKVKLNIVGTVPLDCIWSVLHSEPEFIYTPLWIKNLKYTAAFISYLMHLASKTHYSVFLGVTHNKHAQQSSESHVQ